MNPLVSFPEAAILLVSDSPVRTADFSADSGNEIAFSVILSTFRDSVVAFVDIVHCISLAMRRRPN